MLEVNAKAPTRVDLIGGTLDIWPLHHLLTAKGTINLGVGLFAKTRLKERKGKNFLLRSHDQDLEIELPYEDLCSDKTMPLLSLVLSAFWGPDLPALEIDLEADSPKGAGLGGSSSLGISIGAALVKAKQLLCKCGAISEQDLVQMVQNIEASLLQMPAGCQDHWGALRGRLNYLHYRLAGPYVETFPLGEFSGIADELTLCFCGRSRFSGMNNWDLFKKFGDGHQKVRENFEKIGIVAEKAYQSILDRDWQGLIAYANEDWQHRKALCPEVETAETKRLDHISLKNGAYFTRVCGAGGGGVMAIFAPVSKRETIAAALGAAGAKVFDAGIYDNGLTVEGQI